ncbi:alpha/beta hydrolase [Pontibacter populi]|uniref:Alpha/beta hydrolase n=1 Tax=Pontibacter populi TaxID=890055 RepID=A0ABV1RY59_9BACT
MPANTLGNDIRVTVEIGPDLITFRPTTKSKTHEIIFLQGGLTDPKAYAPLCRTIAENGFTCHLIKMNWRMPQWDYQKVSDLFDLKHGFYIIGGHSQGAKMAAQFVYENPGLMKGLFLIGTSHPRDYDLSSRTLPAVKLYAEFDGLAGVAEVMENKNKLPVHTNLQLIKGGNHSQFGYLGSLLTDETATIDLNEQQRQTSEALIKFFEDIEN